MQKMSATQRVCVYGLINNQKGETLFIKRSEEDTHSGIWELPGGGVDFGEEPRDAIKREIKEETGIEVSIENPIKVFSTISQDGIKQTIRIVFKCAPLENTQVVLSPDHCDYKWLYKENTESFYED
jgi:8-oxo-dGTP diphosphatase